MKCFHELHQLSSFFIHVSVRRFDFFQQKEKKTVSADAVMMIQWIQEEASKLVSASDLHDIVLVDYPDAQQQQQPQHQQYSLHPKHFQTTMQQVVRHSVSAIQHLSLWREQLSFNPVITCTIGAFILLMWTPLLPFVALGYPVFQCFQLATHQQQRNHQQSLYVDNLQFWLRFWTLITPTLLAWIYIVDPLVASWLPLYNLSKALFVLACALPETRVLERAYKQLSRLTMEVQSNRLTEQEGGHEQHTNDSFAEPSRKSLP